MPGLSHCFGNPSLRDCRRLRLASAADWARHRQPRDAARASDTAPVLAVLAAAPAGELLPIVPPPWPLTSTSAASSAPMLNQPLGLSPSTNLCTKKKRFRSETSVRAMPGAQIQCAPGIVLTLNDHAAPGKP